jgi:hypothetical protein
MDSDSNTPLSQDSLRVVDDKSVGQAWLGRIWSTPQAGQVTETVSAVATVPPPAAQDVKSKFITPPPAAQDVKSKFITMKRMYGSLSRVRYMTVPNTSIFILVGPTQS